MADNGSSRYVIDKIGDFRIISVQQGSFFRNLSSIVHAVSLTSHRNLYLSSKCQASDFPDQEITTVRPWSLPWQMFTPLSHFPPLEPFLRELCSSGQPNQTIHLVP